MALSTATITFNISDMLGTDFDTRRTKIWVTTNVDGDTVVDTVGDAIRLGSGVVTLNSDGTGAIVVWVPGTGSNPVSWQTTVHIDYPDAGTRTRKVRDFGPFTITASANLADLIAEQDVPPEYAVGILAEMTALRDEAQAIIDSGGGGGGGTTPDATTTVKGKVELATNAETVTGTDAVRATTPAGVAAALAAAVPTLPDASTTVKGIVELATNAETTTGTDTVRAVTPAGVAAVVANIIPAGADGQILSRDSTKTGGTTWVNPAGGLRYLDRMVPVATGSNIIQMSASDGSQNSANTLSTHSVLFPVDSIRLVYYGGYQGASPTADAMTVTAGIENPFGPKETITFGGKVEGTLIGNGILISDPIPVNFPSGGNGFGASGGTYFSYFQVRTHALATGSSGKLLSTRASWSGISPGEGAEYGASVTDKSMSGTITAATPSTNHPRPAMIIGVPVSGTKPVVLGDGDSIVAGTGDSSSSLQPVGFLARAFYAAALPYVVDGTPSKTIPDIRGALGLADPNLRPNVPGTVETKRQLLYDGATHAVVEYGHNNLSSALNNESLATIQPKSISYWRWHGRHGTRVWQTTITPRSTSSDSWATVGNQTADSNNAARASYNNWLRDGAPLDPTTYAAVAVGTSGARRCAVYDSTGTVVTAASGLVHPLTGGILELADVAESARDSGKWKAASTTDGVHPNATMHALLAAALPVAQFT